MEDSLTRTIFEPWIGTSDSNQVRFTKEMAPPKNPIALVKDSVEIYSRLFDDRPDSSGNPLKIQCKLLYKPEQPT